MTERATPYGPWSGAGLVAADMIGAGVLLSTGFMASSMTPAQILVAWAIGGALAIVGARGYAEAARLVPRGGGEYRYIGSLLHPLVGDFAGFASVLVGLAAPIALDAVATGAFARAVWPGVDPRWVGTLTIVLLTAAHAAGLELSVRVQSGLVLAKIGVVVGLVALGVFAGTLAWPGSRGAPGVGLAGFAEALFYVAFAYSGYNSAVYVADEFASPARDVPRAMAIGSAGVTLLYLALNYVFVTNLDAGASAVVFHYDDFTALHGEWDAVTLAQAFVARLLGPGAARAASAAVALILLSAMSAMTIIGPRIVAAMAEGGAIPRALAGRPGKPPVIALALQGAVAIALVWTHGARTVLGNLGAVLTLFCVLTMLGVLRAAFAPRAGEPRPGRAGVAAAGTYAAIGGAMLAVAVHANPSMLAWLGGVAAVTLVARATRHMARRPIAKA